MVRQLALCFVSMLAAGVATLAHAQAPMTSVTYSTLYVDADGSSHFRDDGRIDLVLPTATERADGDMYFHTMEGVSSVMLTRLTAGMVEEWHPSPQRMFVFGLEGEVEMTASDGATRLVRPGDILLLEDTHGKGHRTHVPGNVDYVGLGILLDDSASTGASVHDTDTPRPGPPASSMYSLAAAESYDVLKSE